MGYSDKEIARVKIPVGLDIGAETPEQIAIAIVGELADGANRKDDQGGQKRFALSLRVAFQGKFRWPSIPRRFWSMRGDPKNFGRVVDPDVQFEELNPLCGDRIRVELRLANGGQILEALILRRDVCHSEGIRLDSFRIRLRARRSLRPSPSATLKFWKAWQEPFQRIRIQCALLPISALRGAVGAMGGWCVNVTWFLQMVSQSANLSGRPTLSRSRYSF